ASRVGFRRRRRILRAGVRGLQDHRTRALRSGGPLRPVPAHLRRGGPRLSL
ncbi:MAG: hypothetical protein AVDCRST_MAG08-1660, partial [uncultured Acetobacteraceae bacterium]